jgi:hypothetical protein
LVHGGGRAGRMRGSSVKQQANNGCADFHLLRHFLGCSKKCLERFRGGWDD